MLIIVVIIIITVGIIGQKKQRVQFYKIGWPYTYIHTYIHTYTHTHTHTHTHGDGVTSELLSAFHVLLLVHVQLRRYIHT